MFMDELDSYTYFERIAHFFYMSDIFYKIKE